MITIYINKYELIKESLMPTFHYGRTRKIDRLEPKQMFYYIQLYRLQNSQILYRMC